jgi:hypothetical protein
LDIKPGQRLYEAWDEAFQNEVQGFNPGDHHMTSLGGDQVNPATCLSESWILGKPQVLFFSLKRVKFSKEQNRVVKSHDYFPFDKVIYADMFMHKNAKRANQVRDEISHMKEKIWRIGAKLRELNSYGNQA